MQGDEQEGQSSHASVCCVMPEYLEEELVNMLQAVNVPRTWHQYLWKTDVFRPQEDSAIVVSREGKRSEKKLCTVYGEYAFVVLLSLVAESSQVLDAFVHDGPFSTFPRGPTFLAHSEKVISVLVRRRPKSFGWIFGSSDDKPKKEISPSGVRSFTVINGDGFRKLLENDLFFTVAEKAITATDTLAGLSPPMKKEKRTLGSKKQTEEAHVRLEQRVSQMEQDAVAKAKVMDEMRERLLKQDGVILQLEERIVELEKRLMQQNAGKEEECRKMCEMLGEKETRTDSASSTQTQGKTPLAQSVDAKAENAQIADAKQKLAEFAVELLKSKDHTRDADVNSVADVKTIEQFSTPL